MTSEDYLYGFSLWILITDGEIYPKHFEITPKISLLRTSKSIWFLVNDYLLHCLLKLPLVTMQNDCTMRILATSFINCKKLLAHNNISRRSAWMLLSSPTKMTPSHMPRGVTSHFISIDTAPISPLCTWSYHTALCCCWELEGTI